MNDAWLTTYTGRRFYVLSATADDILIEDIAHALSNICRYGGHCKIFYSVAEHCVRLSMMVEGQRSKLLALLHDAAEAYIGDIPTLLKHYWLPQVLDVEARLLDLILSKYGVHDRPGCSEMIKHEYVLLAAEVRDLVTGGHLGWYLPEPPDPGQIVPWSSVMAEQAYLRAFDELITVR